MNALVPLLTKRERQIIIGLCEGLSFPEIAEVMRLPPHTVRVIGWRMYPKIGAANSVQAAYLWGCAELTERKGAAVALLREAQALAG